MDYLKSKIRGKFSSRSGEKSDPTPEPVRFKTASASASVETSLSEPPSPEPSPMTPRTSPPSDSADYTGYLWARAYNLVRERDPVLMEEYGRVLANLQGDTAVDIDITSRESVEALVNQLLDNRDRKQWRISLLGRDILLRRQVERLTKFLLWSDPIVKTAVSTQPYAALAWSGVSVFLALLSSGTTQNDAMLHGFNAIGDLQIYWHVCEESYIKTGHSADYQPLVEPLAKLYSYMIEYQARSICYLSASQRCRAWKSIANSNEWSGVLEKIDKQDQHCRDIIGPIEAKRTRDGASDQLLQMRESRTILNDIREILKDGGEEARKTHEDQAERELLRDLASAFTDSSINGDFSWNQASGLESYKNLNPERVPGTCEWFYDDEKFRKWRTADASSLLWVSAGPGCGKSVLSRALIDEDRLSLSVTTSKICYFFFKDGDRRRMHSTNALCALLYQIFEQDPTGSLIQQALPKHRNLGSSLSKDFFRLWQILENCSKQPEAGEIVCLLDALDECDRASSVQLVNTLKEFYCSPGVSSSSKLKLLITSREYDYLAALFDQFSLTAYLQFDGNDRSEDINREIDLVIDYRVKEISPYFTADDQHRISNRLKEIENRTYLWLHLIFDIIQKNSSLYSKRSRIESLLQTIPTEVSEAYEKILSRSPNARYTEIILHIVLAAVRPLSLSEMNVALTLALRDTRFESCAELESDLWLGNFKGVVENLCGLFVTVRPTGLFFLHQTAREFLIDTQREGKWKGRFNLAQSHSVLARPCLQYLLLPSGIDDEGESGDAVDNSKAFLPYAASYWPVHYGSQEATAARLAQTDALALCNVTDPRTQDWMDHYFGHGNEHSGSWTALTLATYLGLASVVRALLDSNTDATSSQDDDDDDEDHGEALCLASFLGHELIVQALLDYGAASITPQSYSIALRLATKARRDDIVSILEAGHANLAQVPDHAPPAYGTSPGSARVVNELFLSLMCNRGWNNLPEKARRQMVAFPPRKKWTLVWQDKLAQMQNAQKAAEA
ncbi:hypothetical protein BJX62DRAFT_240109 [Aspergillus germanicus]